MSWREAVATKRCERQSRLPKEWLIPEDQLPPDNVRDVLAWLATTGWLTPREVQITSATAHDIVARVAARAWTSREVVRAFAHRATIAQQLDNPLTEVNFDEAFQQAEKLDEYLQTEGRTVGPLHGLPISFKDSCDIKGLATTMGYCAWADHIADKDCVLVASLRAAGAIPFVKTNVGHTLMMGETVNHLFGRSLNPSNRSLTPGGSSGGEAALLAFHGSPIGFGTDIGGSIRLPAASCNLYGMRPSPGRVSYRGLADTFIGQEAVRSTLGPMGHSPADLELVMAAYMASEPWLADPDVIPFPWRSPEAVLPHRSCCFAFYDGDEHVTPHPPLRRGMQHVLSRLRAAGHTVVEWRGPLVRDAGRLIVDFWTADGAEEVKARIAASGEPVIPEVAQLLRFHPGSDFTPPTVAQTWKNQHERNIFQQEFSDMWQSTATWTGLGRPIDALIVPAAPFTARPHGADLPESRFGMFEHTFANMPSILQLSTGSFPTGLFQDPEIDLASKDFAPRSDLDSVVQALYTDPEEWRGAPIGLQLVCKRFEEEKIIALLGRIEEALHPAPV